MTQHADAAFVRPGGHRPGLARGPRGKRRSSGSAALPPSSGGVRAPRGRPGTGRAGWEQTSLEPGLCGAAQPWAVALCPQRGSVSGLGSSGSLGLAVLGHPE